MNLLKNLQINIMELPKFNVLTGKQEKEKV